MDNVSFILIEPVHSFVQPPGQLALGDICKGAGIFVYALGPPLARTVPGAAGVSSLEIYVGIMGDPVKPRRELAAARKTIERGPHFQKSLLRQVLSMFEG